MPLNRRAFLGCAAGIAADRAYAAERPLVVFAAASLQGVLTTAAERWTAAGGVRTSISFAASSALARQLEQGAPADLFASADEAWMDWTAARRLIRPETRRSFLRNRLALIAPRSDATTLEIAPNFPLKAALHGGRIALGDPRHVPAGRYARQALTQLGVWEDVAPQIAGVENVRAALALVARGEARLGIVYATDAAAEPRVRVIGLFPETTHDPIRYPFAVTAASTHPRASEFLDHLSGPLASPIFAAAGFIVGR